MGSTSLMGVVSVNWIKVLLSWATAHGDALPPG
jgi:hypothetical protein